MVFDFAEFDDTYGASHLFIKIILAVSSRWALRRLTTCRYIEEIAVETAIGMTARNPTVVIVYLKYGHGNFMGP